MEKNIKFLVLVLLMFVLTGCGWDDVYNKYEDILKDGITCEYEYSKSTGIDCPEKNGKIDCSSSVPKMITLSANKKGPFINGRNIMDEGAALEFDDQFFTLQTSTFDIETYLENYKKNGECPKTISYGTIKTDYYNNQYLFYNYDGDVSYKHEYKLKKDNNMNGGGDSEFDTSCIDSRAVSCKRYRLEACETYATDNCKKITFYVELGRKKDTSNKIREYFVISDIPLDEDDTAEIVYNGDHYYYPLGVTIGPFNYTSYDYSFYVDDEQFDLLFVGENDYTEKLYAQFYNGDYQDMHIYYFLRSTPPEDLDGVFDGYIDDGTSEDTNQGGSNATTTVNGNFKFCNEDGVLKTFQLVGYLIILIKVLVPLLLIIFGSIDFGKAVIASDDKAIQSAARMLVVRAVGGIIIFFIPTIIGAVSGLISSWSSVETEFLNCSKCLLKTGECKDIRKNVCTQVKHGSTVSESDDKITKYECSWDENSDLCTCNEVTSNK